MTLTDLQFGAPLFALLLPLALVILFLAFRRARALTLLQEKIHAAGRLTSPHRLLVKGALLALAWLFLVVAMMQPQGNPRYIDMRLPVTQAQEEVTLIVDVSSSMGVIDRGKSATRLGEALQIADAVARAPFGGKMALMPFTSGPAALVPLSYDRVFLRIALRDLGIDATGIPGTDLLKLFESLPTKEEAEGRTRTYILLSDGEDTLWQTAENPQERLEALRAAYERVGGRWVLIGLGGKEPVAVPGATFGGEAVMSAQAKELLEAFADAGGLYFDAFSAPVAEAIIQELGRVQRGALAQEISAEKLIYTPYFQWPLLIALLFFIAGWTLDTGGRREE